MKADIKTQFPLKGIILLLGSGIIYSLIYFPLYSVVGVVIPMLGLTAVILLGWTYGIGIGVSAGILIGVLDSIFLNQLEFVKLAEDVLGLFFGIGAGGASGWISQLNRTRKDQGKKLEKEKRTLELEIVHRKQVDDRLKESERNLKEAQRISKMGNHSWNIQTGELIWSVGSYTVFGIPVEERMLDYNRFIAMVLPDDRQRVQNAHRKAIEDKKTMSLNIE